MHGETPLFHAARFGDETIMKLLFDEGAADIEARDSTGRTPLFGAVMFANDAVIKLLVNGYAADILARNHDGYTPLLCAIKHRDKATVKLLIEESTANITAKDISLYTRFCYARKYETSILTLLRNKDVADIKRQDNDNQVAAAEREDQAMSTVMSDPVQVCGQTDGHSSFQVARQSNMLKRKGKWPAIEKSVCIDGS
jgi:ankyrin repeat protein